MISNKTRTTSFTARLLIPAVFILTAGMSFASYAATVETDEFGVAYVLNDDGTKDYNGVTGELNESDNATSTGTIIDANKHELSNVNGPTKDQSQLGRPAGMSDAEYAAFTDNTVEWNEIPALVEYRNPTYTKHYSQADSSVSIMQSSYDEFRSQMKEQINELDDSISSIEEMQQQLRASGNADSAAYKALSQSLAAASSGKRSIIYGITDAKTSLYDAGTTVQNAMKGTKNQLISGVETMFITYKTLEVNRELVAAQVELYESVYNTQSDMEAQNLATGTNTATYRNQLNTAKKTLSELDANLKMLKSNIAQQCGYDVNADITIGEIPDPDTAYLNGRDKSADKKLAVDGNSAVTSAGKLSSYSYAADNVHTSNAYSSDGMRNRDLGVNEARGKASTAFDKLYSEVERQIILNDSSYASLRKAELAENSARIKSELGLVGNSEYMGLKMQYISYRASAQLNRLNLIQAITNYEWAMQGVMSVS